MRNMEEQISRPLTERRPLANGRSSSFDVI